jgi:predicted amidophosphoribosyltransferase
VPGRPVDIRFPGCLQCPLLAVGPADVCMGCAAPRMERPGPAACPLCAQLPTPGGCQNELCRSGQRRVGRIYAIGYQTGPLRHAIYRYKYRNERSWAVVFGRVLLGWLNETMRALPPDLIVANPSFVGPGGQRFAHTEAVIEAAAGESGAWNFDTTRSPVVIKTAATSRSAAAAAWSKQASAAELRDALCVTEPSRTTGRRVLLYDDICTTGAQLNALAGCLLDQGRARQVDAVVLARAPWRGTPRPGGA